MNVQHDPSPHSLRTTLTRRQFLRKTALTALVVSGSGALAACGPSAPAPAKTTAPTTGPAAAPTVAAQPATAQPAAPKPAVATSAPAPAAASLAAKPGGELFYALAGKFDGLDPNVTTNTIVGRMSFHLFDQLVREPTPGTFVPGLAEKWDVNATADEYTFSLRKDVMFHDGTPFNAEAVKYIFDRIVNPDLKSQL